MPTAFVEQPDTYIRLRSERLIVCPRRERPEDKDAERPHTSIPICHLDQLVINERVQISTQALAALCKSGIPVLLTGMQGRLLGSCLPPGAPHGATRIEQYRRTLDTPFALGTASRLVQAKIHNQRRLLQRLALRRGSAEAVRTALNTLEALHARAGRAETLDQLRGCEGAASACYFPVWAGFLPAEFPFERRSAHPPHNAVNACISFGAMLVYHELTGRLHACGLDPALGLLHAPDDGRWSLALDLIEPFRPCFIEAIALHLFTHRVLRAEHFAPAQGGIHLNAEGRKLYFHHFERRATQEMFSEHRDHRTTLRREFARAATDYKRALSEPESFAPFRMN